MKPPDFAVGSAYFVAVSAVVFVEKRK